MIRPKNETEKLLLSITENCEMLIKQTHRKPQETLEIRITKPRETFPFKHPPNLDPDSNWMIGLPRLDVSNSILFITKENSQFELHTDTFDEFSFIEIKDELEEILSISDITPNHLQH